jgi:hypothetical protein
MLDAFKKLINKLNVNPDLTIVNLPVNYVLSRLFALSYADFRSSIPSNKAIAKNLDSYSHTICTPVSVIILMLNCPLHWEQCHCKDIFR